MIFKNALKIIIAGLIITMHSSMLQAMTMTCDDIRKMHADGMALLAKELAILDNLSESEQKNPVSITSMLAPLYRTQFLKIIIKECDEGGGFSEKKLRDSFDEQMRQAMSYSDYSSEHHAKTLIRERVGVVNLVGRVRRGMRMAQQD